MIPDFNEVYNKLNESELVEVPPSRKEIISIIKAIQSKLFPNYFTVDETVTLEEIYLKISQQIKAAASFSNDEELDAESLAEEIIRSLPVIKEMLKKDIIALYEGDPAAVCPEEIMLSYPGFYAISIYRIAHEFYIRKIPLLARLMTEYAHEKTGIDIHAGAKIGEYFFIDHGTGIVIGETTTIGNRVKIYQGVTLGAKSFELDEYGNPVKGIKRHPDIGNNVIIYANATILGGKTIIGDGAVIGGNVWLTHSVEPGAVIYYDKKH
ncbi:MAG: serine acetyltransferase [Clostridia bacterium]|nr:serine acetyltransferase [Clostridia bacterium]